MSDYVIFLYILEITVCRHLQLFRCLFIAHQYSFRMDLESGDGPGVAVGTLHTLLDRPRFLGTESKDKNLACIKHCPYSHGQCQLRHLVDIIVKET